MSDEHPTIDHPALGTFTRASTEMTDGTVLTHDWYVGSLSADGTELELMVEATAPEEARALLPRLQATIADLAARRRLASDAVVAEFSQGEPEPSELDEAATDLALETIEVEADGTVILHLTDTCGSHFPEGYWPAVHFGADDDIAQVTVES
ncbi:hypothetical protein [Microbacterium sp. LWO12-1.2]|uniref:hypothetical protein n=1 Tax=Microbacterium sp. LWO12-1.2 TaxID=3135261 RepID=UPI003418307C